MANNNSIYNNFKKLSWLLAIPLMLGVLITSCGDDSPVTPQEQLESAKGTVQGVIVDKATGDPLSGVGVTLVYEDSTDEGSQTFSGSTSSDGSFTFRDVPVTKDAKTNEGDKNNPYTLRLDASSLDNYRDSYLAEIDVVFESTAGDNGAVATDMVSNIRIPLSEQAVTVTGKAHTNSGKAISNATVELYQYFNPVINGDNSTQTEMLVASGETGDDGSFTFEGVEEDASVNFKFIDKSDPANVIDAESGPYTTPAGSEGNATLDLGVIKVSEQNESGAFYLTSVMPEPGSDVKPDTVFKYVFNRSVADNEYTQTDLGFGNGTIKDDIQFDYQGPKKAPGDVEFSVSFSESMDTLMIDPDEGTMKGADEYELNVNSAFNNSKFVDQYGNTLEYAASDYTSGEVETLAFSTNANNSKPHTPSITITSNTVNWGNSLFGEDMTVTWNVSDSPAEVKEYEVYASKNGGNFQHFMTIDRSEAAYGKIEQDFDATNDPSSDDFGDPNNQSFDNDLLVVNQTAATIDESNTYELKVRAVSANLREGDFSNSVTFEDVVKPRVGNVTQGTAAQNEENVLYVEFSEPMDKPSAETASEYSTDSNSSINITDISYDYGDITNPANGQAYDLKITVSSASNLSSGSQLSVTSNVTDLNSNGMDSNNNTGNY